MTLSEETINVLDYLEQNAPQGLRKRSDLGLLLELAMRREAHEEMNDLTFNGRHLYGVYNTLRREGAGGEGYRKLEEEFSAAVERLRELMARLMADAEQEQVERFNRVYYAATHGSLRNVVDLAHDLGVMKGVQNEQKYGSPGDDDRR